MSSNSEAVGRVVAGSAKWLDRVAIVCLLLGETISGVLWPRCLFLWFTPAFWAGIVLVTVRHLIWPRPSLPAQIARHVKAAWRAPDIRRTWSIALVSRVSILAVGLAAVLTVGYTLRPLQFRVSRSEVANLPARYDAGWYLTIARRGYDWRPELRGRQQNIAFFPVYPALMRVGGDAVTVVAKATRDPELFGGGNARVLWGGVLVSIMCFGLALRRVFRLAEVEQLDRQASARAVVLLAAYPFALFYSAPYSESAYLLASVSTVLAWSTGGLRAAGVWGILTGLVRSNGWTLSAALLVGLLAESRYRDRARGRLLVAVCPILGAALFSAYTWHATGDPFEWVRAQQGWGRQVVLTGFLTRRLTTIRESGIIDYVLRDPVDATTCVALVWLLAMVAVLASRRRWLYVVLLVSYVAPALVIDLPATGRMTSVLFPAFIATAALIRGRLYATVVVLSAVGQVFLAGRFFLWRPPY